MEKDQPSAAIKTHLLEHIENWPASKNDIVSACNNMSDVSEEEKKKFEEMLPDGTYNDSAAVFKAMNDAMAKA